MARSEYCGGCGTLTSFIYAAQFQNGINERVIICPDCWGIGKRCFIGPTGLLVATEKPEGFREAALYWDEGGYVTGDNSNSIYPSTEQPNGV